MWANYKIKVNKYVKVSNIQYSLNRFYNINNLDLSELRLEDKYNFISEIDKLEILVVSQIKIEIFWCCY